MKRTLYLHLGAHRTATTSVQSFLYENFDALQKRGVLYPFRVRRHHKLLNAIMSGDRDVGDAAADLERRAAARPHPIRSIVLSHEDVAMHRDLSVLARFREHFDVKVIYALRRQDTWLESWYFQNIKVQWDPELAHLTFDAFMDRRAQFHWIHYDRYVAHLEELFGAENVLLYVFERGQMPDGPVATFARQIGMTDLEGLEPARHVNSSRSSQMSEFMRRLPLDMADPAARLVLTQSCEVVDREILGKEGKQNELLLPYERRQEILETYAAGNAAIAKRRFGRDTLFLDPLPDPDAPLARLELPTDSAELMDRFITPLVAELIRRSAIVPPAQQRSSKP